MGAAGKTGSERLTLAIKARLPLVQVSVPDLAWFEELVEHVAGARPYRVSRDDRDTDLERTIRRSGEPRLLWSSDQVAGQPHALVEVYGALRATLVVVNQDQRVPCAFQAGGVEAPAEFLVDRLEAAGFARRQARDAVHAMVGLSAHQAESLARIVQAAGGVLGAGAAGAMRHLVVGTSRGLGRVPTDVPYHRDGGELEPYLSWALPWFWRDDRRLRPRGVLLAGRPGTGKSSAAPWIAGRLGVPCLRLDVGALKAKYVGESEEHARAALEAVDSSAPCVLLLDELEKLFAPHHDDGVSQSLLAALLWWMQARDSRVLVVATTNDAGRLPPELVRPGRLDGTIWMPGLDEAGADEFALGLAATFLDVGAAEREAVLQAVGAVEFGEDGRVPQADVEAAVLSAVRELLGGKVQEGRRGAGAGRRVGRGTVGGRGAAREGVARRPRRRGAVDAGADGAGPVDAETPGPRPRRRRGAGGGARSR